MQSKPTRNADPCHANERELIASRAKSLQTVQIVFSTIVLVCIACGLTTYLFDEQLRIPITVREPVSLAFLITALVDLVILLGCSAWLSRN